MLQEGMPVTSSGLTHYLHLSPLEGEEEKTTMTRTQSTGVLAHTLAMC